MIDLIILAAIVYIIYKITTDENRILKKVKRQMKYAERIFKEEEENGNSN